MKIEIWSDIVCPFCYIGKRRIEKALKQFPNADKIQIEWKSFLLNPDMVTDPSKKTVEYLSEVKGWTLEESIQMTQQVTQMAEEEGLVYNMDQALVANPKDAHRVLQYAKTQDKGDVMKERLLKAYFTEGINIADFDELVRLAVEVGLDETAVKNILDTGQFIEGVEFDIYESQQLKVRGVPFFVLNDKFGISGAQPLEVFTETLETAWADYIEDQPVSEIKADGTDNVCDIEGEC